MLMIHILSGLNDLKTITIAKIPLFEFLQKQHQCMMKKCKQKYYWTEDTKRRTFVEENYLK